MGTEIIFGWVLFPWNRFICQRLHTVMAKARRSPWAFAELFAVAPPGLELVVADELRERGFKRVQVEVGGVSFRGHPLRANRVLACPTRILQRVGRFPAPNFQALERGVKALDLSPFGGVTPQASCRKSKL